MWSYAVTSGILSRAVSYRLSPCAGTNTFDRGGFLIHADSIRFPGTASEGCIVVVQGVSGIPSREIRESIALSGDADLEVV